MLKIICFVKNSPYGFPGAAKTLEYTKGIDRHFFIMCEGRPFLEQVPPVYNAFLISEKSIHHGRLDGDAAPIPSGTFPAGPVMHRRAGNDYWLTYCVRSADLSMGNIIGNARGIVIGHSWW